MTPDAKRALATAIRAARARLLDDLHAAAESAYRLSVRPHDAGLDHAARTRRNRLESWIAEQIRTQSPSQSSRSADDFRREAEKQAAYTLLNRLVLLRLLEAPGPSGSPLRTPAVVTGGWESRGYTDFRQLAPALARGDDSEGFAFLLQLVFEDLATDLPGLYGPAGIADLIPVPAATLRYVVDALNAPELDSCWSDDMTLGWVYQYWNDPEREAIDDKLNDGGKVEPHEIASKTQMFTERYMVDWLLQNSLCPLWLAMCQKHGWTPEVVAAGVPPAVEGGVSPPGSFGMPIEPPRDGTLHPPGGTPGSTAGETPAATNSILDRLEQRRADWRSKRERGEVALTDLMPLHTDTERRWAYYVPQPIPADAVQHAPDSIRDLRLLDPAVGSGHFLVVALDLLVALYREEARHRGESGTERWSDCAIVERILGHNLHGIDLDPRAVQIAAAALWLKARHIAPDAHPEQLQLVASNLRLASLPDDDSALVELRREVERETGIPAALTDTLVHALRGADHLGSLLKVDHAVDEALARHEDELGRVVPEQGDIFAGFAPKPQRVTIGKAEARATLLDRLESFLGRHTGGDDLGLRLRGEQLAAGVRFVRLIREGTYDLVVANPPYQGTSKMSESKYVEKAYPLGKADLYAAFLMRGLELVREGGVSAMLTMRNWMFIQQYSNLRRFLLGTYDLRALGDVSWGAFREMRDNPVVLSVMMRCTSDASAVAVAPTDPQERVRTQEEFAKKEAGLRCQEGRHTFDPAALKIVPEWPLVYWWSEETVRQYARAPKLGSVAPVRTGLCTSDNTRFLRKNWESITSGASKIWSPYVSGAKGSVWMDPCDDRCNWYNFGLELKSFNQKLYGSYSRVIQNEEYYFVPGIAYTPIGNQFWARAHRRVSIMGKKGSSVFPRDLAPTLCGMNSRVARRALESLNPGIDFQVGDVNRLPLFPIANAAEIFAQVEAAFGIHEAHREPSVEFKHPGPSPWRHVQDWAQTAVDRPEGAPLPAYVEVLDPEPPTDHMSFALGVALGRFGAHGEGVLDPAAADLAHALPHALLFLDTTLDDTDLRDGLGHPAAAPLHAAWATYGPAIDLKRGLRDWLALDFFKDVHKGMYENRPIHWPLSSAGKTFVAWVNIHRFNAQTLRVLLADHLLPTQARIDGELNDLRIARDGADKKAARAAEKQLDRVLKARDELQTFITAVEQCADRGAPPADPKCPAREQDARYDPDLDDGVMINSAALWPLLDPQWKDPKKWWKELATAVGRKDYDWSHLAMRYWPTRVDAKCRLDPSLGVAHGCFWRYHPARAWSWELRLQDEIGPDFRIVEAPYRPGGRDVGDAGDGPHRVAWLRDHADEALAAIEKEATRRMGRGAKRKPVSEMRILESGLWTAHPAAIWEMELRLAELQGQDLRILAPDEPAARAAYETANPGKVDARREFLANLIPPPTIFGEPVDDPAETPENVSEPDEEADV